MFIVQKVSLNIINKVKSNFEIKSKLCLSHRGKHVENLCQFRTIWFWCFKAVFALWNGL